jgi:hypothetical protein
MRYRNLTGQKLIRIALVNATAALAVFVILGAWIGKIDLSASSGVDRTTMTESLEPAYFYATSGFAYLNRILVDEQPAWSLARSGYPLAMVAYQAGLAERPPPQVNEFINVPMLTNVGTFLEPLYRDGGVGLLIGGLVLLPFLSGLLGLWLLRQASVFGLVGWSTTCFCSFMSFFTPKFNNAPTWLFIAVGVIATVWTSCRVHRE